MSKSIIVMDMPDSCDKCPLFHSHYSDMCCGGLNNRGINYPYPKDFRQEWCPLKELPEKMKYCNGTYNGEVKGWNECIEEILKENKLNEG